MYDCYPILQNTKKTHPKNLSIFGIQLIHMNSHCYGNFKKMTVCVEKNEKSKKHTHTHTQKKKELKTVRL